MIRDTWETRLNDLSSRHLERHMRVMRGPAGSVIATGDGDKLNFCSNDYLGLASDIRIKRALTSAAETWGTSSASSRLVSGNTEAHEALEEELSAFLGTEEAVGFPSGYQANVGAVTALTQVGDAIFSDALVHASIVDGCRLSKADVHIYKHRDVADLERLLKINPRAPIKLIVTDGVFSMDGDMSPLLDICDLASKHGAFVYVDEAHSMGVMGKEGRGLVADLGLEEQVAVRVGTFGKAFGTCGAFVATSRTAARLIRSRARSLLYTTAEPAPLIEATRVSLGIVRNAEDKRRLLRRNVGYFTARAREEGLGVLPSTTPIQPVLVGTAAAVMAASAKLWDKGLFVQGIRPPTVPEGTSRLRITLTASHTEEHIDRLIEGLSNVL